MTVTTSGDGLTVHVDEPRETIVLNVVGMDHVTGRGDTTCSFARR